MTVNPSLKVKATSFHLLKVHHLSSATLATSTWPLWDKGYMAIAVSPTSQSKFRPKVNTLPICIHKEKEKATKCIPSPGARQALWETITSYRRFLKTQKAHSPTWELSNSTVLTCVLEVTPKTKIQGTNIELSDRETKSGSLNRDSRWSENRSLRRQNLIPFSIPHPKTISSNPASWSPSSATLVQQTSLHTFQTGKQVSE